MAMSPAGGGSDLEGGYRPLSEINVTPLVDVMLVLLIVFMVTAPLMMVGVPVQLPKTTATKVSQPSKPVIVSVTKDAKVFLREEEVEQAALAARLRELKDTNKDTVVYVRGDRTVPYGKVMEVMGQVTQAGFPKVSLIAEGAAAPARAR